MGIENEVALRKGKVRKQEEAMIATARHMLAVCRGECTKSAPAAYVAALFDDYADHFETCLLEQLNYDTPRMLAKELQRAIDTRGPIVGVRRCVDLGCGTGLMAPLLRKLGVKDLLGVDLSSKMLEKAKEKGPQGIGYDRLFCGDIITFLQTAVDAEGVDAMAVGLSAGAGFQFDLVVAADVFVYVGDLRPVLEAICRRLTTEPTSGLLAFSTEALVQ